MKTILIIPIAIFSLAMLQDDPWQASIESGQALYEEYCITCHLGQGEGVEGVYPPLAASDYLTTDIPRAIGILRDGQMGEIVVNGETYNSYMPAPGLDDDELRDIMNYILNSWGNKAEEMITLETVQAN